MSGRVSPFAALTGSEKQIKWLEVQSIRLPYVQGRLERNSSEAAERITQAENAEAKPYKNASKHSAEPAAEASIPDQAANAETRASHECSEFQKIRHRQYDAVVARMRQAKKNARGYQPLP